MGVSSMSTVVLHGFHSSRRSGDLSYVGREVDNTGIVSSFPPLRPTQPAQTSADNARMTKSIMLVLVLSACAIPGLTTTAHFGTSSDEHPTAASAPVVTGSSARQQPVVSTPAPGSSAPLQPVTSTPRPVPPQTQTPASVATSEPDDDANVPSYMTPQPDALIDTMRTIKSYIKLLSGDYLNPSGNDDAVAAKEVEDCRFQLASRIKQGQSETTIISYKPNHDRFSLGELRATCDKLEIIAKEWGARNRKASAAQDAELAAPYFAAKLTDDKLQMAQRGTFYGIGGVELAPPALKKASVWFEVVSVNEDDWTLFRHVFHGDHLVSTTREGFLRRPGPSKFR